jgi:cytochrome c oxidase subunit II
MKRTGLIWGLVLVVVGVIGLMASFAVIRGTAGRGVFSSPGERIYFTGVDANGPIPRSVAGGGMMGYDTMGALACADCHGQDGRGGRVTTLSGTIDVPDIRYSALTQGHMEGTETVPGWTDADIARAIRDGIDPDDQSLMAPMPRWHMTDADVADVIAYLKELSKR